MADLNGGVEQRLQSIEALLMLLLAKFDVHKHDGITTGSGTSGSVITADRLKA